MPNHVSLVLAYFQLWWCGAMAAHSYLAGARSVWAMRTSLGWLIALCMWAGLVVALEGSHGPGYYPVLPLRHFAVAAAMLAVFYGPPGRLAAQAVLPFGRAFTAAASISYGLYVLHYPLLVDWTWARSPVGLVGAALLLVVLAYLVERKLPLVMPKAPRD